MIIFKLVVIFFQLFALSNKAPIDFIKKELSIKSEWMLKNPVLEKVEKSFFTKKNAKNIFVFPISISLKNELFFWDCENRILNQINSIGNISFSLQTINDTNNYPIFEELVPDKSIAVNIYTDNASEKSKIVKWRKDNNHECPGNHSFPYWQIDSTGYGYNFPEEDIINISENLYGTIIGIVDLNFSILAVGTNFPQSTEVEMKLLNGKKIKGIGWDLNQDGILDIFSYIEKKSEITSDRYFRLYINLNGKWRCKWVELIEDCV